MPVTLVLFLKKKVNVNKIWETLADPPGIGDPVQPESWTTLLVSISMHALIRQDVLTMPQNVDCVDHRVESTTAQSPKRENVKYR